MSSARQRSTFNQRDPSKPEFASPIFHPVWSTTPAVAFRHTLTVSCSRDSDRKLHVTQKLSVSSHPRSHHKPRLDSIPNIRHVVVVSWPGGSTRNSTHREAQLACLKQPHVARISILCQTVSEIHGTFALAVGNPRGKHDKRDSRREEGGRKRRGTTSKICSQTCWMNCSRQGRTSTRPRLGW